MANASHACLFVGNALMLMMGLVAVGTVKEDFFTIHRKACALHALSYASSAHQPQHVPSASMGIT
jgi:hypothetical protein